MAKNRKNAKIKYSNPKCTFLAQNTSNKRRAVTIHPPAQLVGEPKKTEKKEGRNKDAILVNWLFAQTTHVVRSKSNFAWWVGCGV